VYLALQGRLGLEKLCVVKRLLPEEAGHAERLARFRREAEIARRLSHGAIAQTLAVDEVDGEPFIVQEFLEGRTVAQVVAAAQSAGLQMPVPLAVHIVREIARALAYAHRLEGGGVVHRDVSPHNIMLTFSGEVRLIDFGIARGSADPALTMAGTLVGKESYIAPELFRGATADRRADTYSLGVVLWELLAGGNFWTGESSVPPPSSLLGPAAVPRELDAVAMKAIAPQPDERYQSGDDLHGALGDFLPSTFVGDAAVAEFLAGCYDVETLRRHQAEAIAEGKTLLESESAPTPEAPPAPSRGRHAPLIAAALGAVAVVTASAFLWPPGRKEAVQSQPAPIAAPVAQAAAPVASAPPQPPVAAAPTPTTTIAKVEAPRAAEAPAAPDEAKPTPRVRARAGGAAVDALLTEAHDSLQIGELAGAEREARHAMKEGTPVQKARAHAIVGQVFVLGGRSKDAEAEFAEAVRLDPSNKTANEALARLQGRSLTKRSRVER
jgi:tRNA A-37 threonylcarbamoyl transferase component Bud32